MQIPPPLDAGRARGQGGRGSRTMHGTPRGLTSLISYSPAPLSFAKGHRADQ